MKTLTRAHALIRCTTNTTREPARAARVRCDCGQEFYGPTRLDALDAYTPHVIEARQVAAFAHRAAMA